jgi:hypothetical protein
MARSSGKPESRWIDAGRVAAKGGNTSREQGNGKLIKRTFLVASAVIGLAMASAICTAAPSECKLVRIAEWPVRLET